MIYHCDEFKLFKLAINLLLLKSFTYLTFSTNCPNSCAYSMWKKITIKMDNFLCLLKSKFTKRHRVGLSLPNTCKICLFSSVRNVLWLCCFDWQLCVVMWPLQSARWVSPAGSYLTQLSHPSPSPPDILLFFITLNPLHAKFFRRNINIYLHLCHYSILIWHM